MVSLLKAGMDSGVTTSPTVLEWPFSALRAGLPRLKPLRLWMSAWLTVNLPLAAIFAATAGIARQAAS